MHAGGGNSITKSNRAASGGKGRGMTLSKGGVPLVVQGRRRRKHYPSSWGYAPDQIKMKKRVLCVFDGPRRLWKDDMMLDLDHEVRVRIREDGSYVTDLDVETLKRANAIHNATEEEKGPWVDDDVEIEWLMS